MKTRVGRLPLVDSHIHLWEVSKYSGIKYPWLDSHPELNKSFLLKELRDATQSFPVKSFVFVQADCEPSQSLAEVEWVTKLAEKNPRICGIVAHAPLENGADVRQHLIILKKNPLVKGVRRLLQNENTEFFSNPKFIEGVKMLAEFDFSFDICIKASQLPAAIELVKLCPGVKFVLDHLGKPDVAGKQFTSWQENITKLALLPGGVHCKISGLITEANHKTWHVDDLRPYVLHAIQAFGIDRVIFGSDWPVVNLAGTYIKWINALDNMVSSFSEKDLRKLLYQNCENFYRLPSPVPTSSTVHSFHYSQPTTQPAEEKRAAAQLVSKL